jgi:hypothetical protein
MFRGLSTDQAPPFEVVYRFFLFAPLFLIIAGALILFNDSEVVLSRHSFVAISIIHLFTVGYMSMIMIGASMQFLPVIVGAIYKKVHLITKILLSSLILFLILFLSGFLLEHNQLLFYASEIIFASILFFVFISLISINQTTNSDNTTKSIKIAFIMFGIGTSLGVYLLLSFSSNNFSQSHFDISFAHAILMIFGWGLFFIFGIALKVVPMFWVASDYEDSQIKSFIYMSLIAISLIVLNIYFGNETLKIVALSYLGLVLLLFSYTTIDKLNNRKRKISDISVELWQMSMRFLFVGGLLIFASFFIEIEYVLIAIVFGYGFIVTLTIGMLYKIIPFLSWWHSSTILAQKGIFSVPTVRDMIPSKELELQKKLHYITIIFLIVGVKFGLILKIAGFMIMISNIYLFRNFLSAINSYKKLIK